MVIKVKFFYEASRIEEWRHCYFFACSLRVKKLQKRRLVHGVFAMPLVYELLQEATDKVPSCVTMGPGRDGLKNPRKF